MSFLTTVEGNPVSRKPSAAVLLERIWAETYATTVHLGLCRGTPEYLAGLTAQAKALIQAYARPPFDPARSAGDRAFQNTLDGIVAELTRLKESRRIMAARLAAIRQQVATIPEPQKTHGPLVVTGTAGFTVAFAPAIFYALGKSAGDAMLAWAFSIGVAALIGIYLMLNLLSEQHESGHSRFRWPAIAVGISFGLLRLSQADALEGVIAAAGLTILDVAIVIFAERYAANHSQAMKHFRESQALRIGQEASLADIDRQIAELEGQRARMIEELEQREADVFDVARLEEAASATAEAAYRAALAYSQQLLEGGSPAITTSLSRVAELGFQVGGR